MLNANKRNISLNLKSPEGATVLKELAAKADVLIENYAGRARSSGRRLFRSQRHQSAAHLRLGHGLWVVGANPR